MSLRTFFRLLVRGVPDQAPSVRHRGHEVARLMRDATGPQTGGGQRGGPSVRGDAVHKLVGKTSGESTGSGGPADPVRR